MATLYTHKTANIRKTWFLLTGFLLFIIGVGWLFSYALDSPAVLYVAVALSVAMSIGSYWYSDKLVTKMAKAKPVDESNYPELQNIVENLCITAGLPLPKIYLIEDAQPNAFATGRNPKHAVIAVTEGLLQKLDRSELEGVISHELAHIGNNDMLLQTVIVVLAGTIAITSNIFLRITMFRGSQRRQQNALYLALALAAAILAPIAATLIRLAISRKREFLADATGALLTRYPEGLASALEKISSYPKNLKAANEATAHLYIANPFRGKKRKNWLTKLFMTHPSAKKRIKALRGLNVDTTG